MGSCRPPLKSQSASWFPWGGNIAGLSLHTKVKKKNEKGKGVKETGGGWVVG